MISGIRVVLDSVYVRMQVQDDPDKTCICVLRSKFATLDGTDGKLGKYDFNLLALQRTVISRLGTNNDHGCI